MKNGLELFISDKFKKDWKKLEKKHYDYSKLEKVIEIIISNNTLPLKYKDHFLKGEWVGFKECYIESNWLLIYYIENNKITLVRTGTRDDLFR